MAPSLQAGPPRSLALGSEESRADEHGLLKVPSFVNCDGTVPAATVTASLGAELSELRLTRHWGQTQHVPQEGPVITKCSAGREPDAPGDSAAPWQLVGAPGLTPESGVCPTPLKRSRALWTGPCPSARPPTRPGPGKQEARPPGPR